MKRSDASHKNSQPQYGRRLEFDVFELLRAAGGFDREDGYVVMPREIADQIKEELERLYSVQETAVLLREYLTPRHSVDAQDEVGLRKLLDSIRETAV